MSLPGRINGFLAEARERSLLRTLRSYDGWDNCRLLSEGKELMDFSSSDYLSLATDTELLHSIEKNIPGVRLGSVASPLITGHSSLHEVLEKWLAKIFRKNTGLLFPSGWQANVSIIPALFGDGDVILSDERNHASLIDGIKLSGAKPVIFRHLDYSDCEEKLIEARDNAGDDSLIGVFSDTVFSIEGDVADPAKLLALKRKYGAVLLLDTSHGLPGIGRESESILGFDKYLPDAEIVTSSLGKYFCAGGGFVGCSEKMKQLLVNRSRGFIYSSSFSPLLVSTLLSVIERIGNDPTLTLGLKENITYLRSNLADMGILSRAGNSEGPICGIPVVAERAVEAGEALIERGILVTPIRYPSVPKGSAKLRISLMRGHTREMIDDLMTGLVELSGDGLIMKS